MMRGMIGLLVSLALAVLPVAGRAQGSLGQYLEPLPPAAAPQEAPAGADCANLGSGDYWFCRAVATPDCSLAQAADYWRCKALTEANCTLTQGEEDYWFCRSVSDANCPLARGEGAYTMCVGLIRGDCTIVREARGYWLCRAWSGRLPRRQAG